MKEEEKQDPLGAAEQCCHISSSQEELLRRCPWALQTNHNNNSSRDDVYHTPPEDSMLPTTEEQNPDDAVDSELNKTGVDLSREDSEFEHDVVCSLGFDGDTEVIESGVGNVDFGKGYEDSLIEGLKRHGSETGIEIEGADKKKGKLILDTGSRLSGDTEVIETGGKVGIEKGESYVVVQCDGEEEGKLGKKIISELGMADSCVRFDGDTEVIETDGDGGSVVSCGVQGDDIEGVKLGTESVEDFDKYRYVRDTEVIETDGDGGGVESCGVQVDDSEGVKLGMKSIEDFDKYRYVGGTVTVLSSPSSCLEMKGKGGVCEGGGGGLRMLPRSFCAPAEEDVVAPTPTDDALSYNKEEEDQEFTLLDVLRMIARKKHEPDHVSMNEKVSIYKTAESCGITFPRPKWWPPEGLPKDYHVLGCSGRNTTHKPTFTINLDSNGRHI